MLKTFLTDPNVIIMARHVGPDEIVRDPQLLLFFEKQLTTGVVDDSSYIMLSEAIKERRVRRCGFIADDVQKLTKAATYGPGNRQPKGFFATDFTL